METTTDTPRTNAAVATMGYCTENGCLDTVAVVSLCHDLERELASTRVYAEHNAAALRLIRSLATTQPNSSPNWIAQIINTVDAALHGRGFIGDGREPEADAIAEAMHRERVSGMHRAEGV